MEAFFKNKLGVTFDGVKTAPHADAGAIYRPLDENEKRMVQANVEMIYAQFKQRVADGRKRDTSYIDSIAQGRVWTGLRARDIGLIDRFGGIDDAVKAAAAKAGLTDYSVREYPEPKNIFEQIFGKQDPMNYSNKLKQELGEDNFKIYQELRNVRQMSNTVQAKLPFSFYVR
jgi:protease-4